MKVSKVKGAFFSPTGTTKKIVVAVVQKIAETLQVESELHDFTLPVRREQKLVFAAGEVVVFGMPVYAGRLPNLLLKYLQIIEGNGAFAIPIVLYGNRNYDDALVELCDILYERELLPFAAAAFVGEHSFSTVLGQGRPDKEDMAIAEDFARQTAAKLKDSENIKIVQVKGTPKPYSGYYQPRDGEGGPIDMRKVKPLTNEHCNDCKLCVKVCPMEAIDFGKVGEVTGICIKCGACIKKCPQSAKYYEDIGYLFHKKDLEEKWTRRAVPEIFL